MVLCVKTLAHESVNWRDATEKGCKNFCSSDTDVLLNKHNQSEHVIFQRVSTGVTGKNNNEENEQKRQRICDAVNVISAAMMQKYSAAMTSCLRSWSH